jgi:hypothetical protein
MGLRSGTAIIFCINAKDDELCEAVPGNFSKKSGRQVTACLGVAKVPPYERQVPGKRVASTNLASGKYHPSERQVPPLRAASTTLASG